jgi:hypothetical protein
MARLELPRIKRHSVVQVTVRGGAHAQIFGLAGPYLSACDFARRTAGERSQGLCRDVRRRNERRSASKPRAARDCLARLPADGPLLWLQARFPLSRVQLPAAVSTSRSLPMGRRLCLGPISPGRSARRPGLLTFPQALLSSSAAAASATASASARSSPSPIVQAAERPA